MEFTLNPDGSLAPADGDDENPDATPGEIQAPAPGAPGGAAPPDAPPNAPGGLIHPGAVDAADTPRAAPGDLIKDSDTANFMADVIDASARVPVIVDFWAPWCGPCKQLTPMLEKAVKAAAGAVVLVKINVDENQDLAAQMRIQSIPAVYAFRGGQPVDGFMGAVTESQLKTFIGRLTGGAKSPVDTALEQAKEALEAGDTMTAGAIFAKVQSQDPMNDQALAGMIRVALADGDRAGAKALVDGLPPESLQKPEIAAAIAAVELSEQGQESGDVQELRAKLAGNEDDHQTRFELAMALFGDGQNEAAINELLDLFRRDRAWNDDAARTQLVKIFEALGATHPLTVDGRKRLSTLLFS